MTRGCLPRALQTLGALCHGVPFSKHSPCTEVCVKYFTLCARCGCGCGHTLELRSPTSPGSTTSPGAALGPDHALSAGRGTVGCALRTSWSDSVLLLDWVEKTQFRKGTVGPW